MRNNCLIVKIRDTGKNGYEIKDHEFREIAFRMVGKQENKLITTQVNYPRYGIITPVLCPSSGRKE